MFLRKRNRLNLGTLAMSYDSAKRVYERKGIWMVHWLRARRTGDTLRRWYLEQHFAARVRRTQEQ